MLGIMAVRIPQIYAVQSAIGGLMLPRARQSISTQLQRGCINWNKVIRMFRLTRTYKRNGVTRIVNQQFESFEKVYKSIIRSINKCEEYKFDHNKMVLCGSDSMVILELYNDSKPCYIPLSEVVFSHQSDPKYRRV